MNWNLVVTAEARAEIKAAFSWYENERTGLGEKFIADVDETLERIREMPELYAPVYRNFRALMAGRFPYRIHYYIDDDRVVVFEVIHGGKDLRQWKRRLSRRTKRP